MLTGIIFLHSHKIFSIFSFKLATAGWTQLGIHHLILQTAPQFLLSQLILSASPPMNPPGHARIYELEWRMPTRRLTTKLEWTVSDEEGETFPPRKVWSQPCHQEEEATQRLKRSVFSFKVSKFSLKVSKSPLRKMERWDQKFIILKVLNYKQQEGWNMFSFGFNSVHILSSLGGLG